MYEVFYSWINDLKQFGPIFFIFFLVLVILIIIAMILRDKFLYTFKVRIFRTRENGKVIEINKKGGFITRGSITFFVIKYGPFWWQNKYLTENPRLDCIDEENRVYYKQIGINSFVQLRRVFKEDEVQLIPVETDIEYGAILSIQRIKDVLNPKDLWKTVISIGAIVLIFSMGIIGWALLMNAKCPNIP